MTDTAKSSHITDHAFEPRTRTNSIIAAVGRPGGWVVTYSLTPYLCGHPLGTRFCNLAEAAHRETTVKRGA